MAADNLLFNDVVSAEHVRVASIASDVNYNERSIGLAVARRHEPNNWFAGSENPPPPVFVSDLLQPNSLEAFHANAAKVLSNLLTSVLQSASALGPKMEETVHKQFSQAYSDIVSRRREDSGPASPTIPTTPVVVVPKTRKVAAPVAAAEPLVLTANEEMFIYGRETQPLLLEGAQASSSSQGSSLGMSGPTAARFSVARPPSVVVPKDGPHVGSAVPEVVVEKSQTVMDDGGEGPGDKSSESLMQGKNFRSTGRVLS